MNKRLIIVATCLLSYAGLVAQTWEEAWAGTQPTGTQYNAAPVVQYASPAQPQQTTATQNDSKGHLLGLSGGLMVHAGYAFAKDQSTMYHNPNLSTSGKYDGMSLGASVSVRVHLISHLHVGAEAGVSVIPLSKDGSRVTSAWGGAFCDFYWNVKKVQLLAGAMLGGGNVGRLYVSDAVQIGEDTYSTTTYVRTPCFLLDPYIGVEIPVAKRVAILVKLDYMLPFGKKSEGVRMTESIKETIKWNNFLEPSGPRLHVGVMFGNH